MIGRPKKHGDRTRIQLRSSVQIVLAASKAAAAAGEDRNTWIVRVLTRVARNGLPIRLWTAETMGALGGDRDNLTIDLPDRIADQIDQRAIDWQIPRSTWINLALSDALKDKK